MRSRVKQTVVVVALLVLAAGTAGCPTSDAIREPTTPPPPTPKTPVAHVHFLVDDAPQDGAGFSEVPDGTAVRYGDPIDVVVDGLDAGSTVTIDGALDGMKTSATFLAADDGSVDLARDAPVSGAWQGVDPEGILWSMQGTADTSTLDLTLHVDVVVDGAVVGSGSLARRPIDQGLFTLAVSDGTRQGEFVSPQGTGPFPAVLVFGGSEGGTSTGVFDAFYLGSLGYAAFGVGYFGAPGLPQELADIPIEILEDDLEFLASQPRVDANRIAVMGGSRGGELALLLGSLFPDRVHAVIANVPSGVVWGGNVEGAEKAAWTYHGDPIAYVPDIGAPSVVTVDAQGKQHVAARNSFFADVAAAAPATLDAATIRVENTHGPILLLGGADDQLWGSCTLGAIAFSRLQATGHQQQYGDESHCFTDTGHLIGIPGWSTFGSDEYFDPVFGFYLVTGGTPAGYGAADRASDTIIRHFLERL